MRSTGRRKPAASTSPVKTVSRPSSITRSSGKGSREHLLQLPKPGSRGSIPTTIKTGNKPHSHANRWDHLVPPIAPGLTEGGNSRSKGIFVISFQAAFDPARSGQVLVLRRVEREKWRAEKVPLNSVRMLDDYAG